VKALSGKDFAKLLERRGWILQRVNGSHHIYSKEGNPARISLPVHRNLQLKVGLQKHLMKIAEIIESEL